MRKLALALAIVMLMSTLAVSASAASVEPRAITIIPGITFDGTTANCEVAIAGNYTTDEMVATIRLYRGNTIIASWRAEGDGHIFFTRTKEVTKGYTYRLVVSLTVNGQACSPVYVTGDCK